MKQTASRGRVSAATGVSRTMPRGLAAAQVHAQLLPLGEDVFLAEEPGVAEQFLAVGVEEDLRGDHLDAVFLAGVLVLPDVDELDVELARVFLLQTPPGSGPSFCTECTCPRPGRAAWAAFAAVGGAL